MIWASCNNCNNIDAPHKSGFARAVDIIDFFLYIVPTVYIDALEDQQNAFDMKIARRRQQS